MSACPACGSSETKRAMTVAGHVLLRCRSCLTLFVAEPPSDAELRGLYDGGREYYANPEYGPPGSGSLLGYRDYLADRAQIEAKFDGVLAQIERHVSPGRLLDVGCGPGFLLSAATARGWQATGIDLNQWAVDRARELGLDASLASLEDAAIEPASLQAITMMDLVEHLSNPAQAIDQAARLLAPGGVLALLTPDAGSPVSRLLGRRWPEVQRVPEHLVLFSASGLAALLSRHGFRAVGWHSVGKTSSVETLLADVAPAAPGLAARVRRRVAGRPLARRELELDPRTKFVLYAVLEAEPVAAEHDDRPIRPARIPKRPTRLQQPDDAILEDLGVMARARRLSNWMFDELGAGSGGRVVEIGAGIGTFSERLLAAGASPLLLIEPEPQCAGELERRFGGDRRVEIARDALPDSPALRRWADSADLVVCQNVLEHIADDGGALRAMAGVLRPGGRLALLVPAHPRLFGSLDVAYGHRRRYTPGRLRTRLGDVGLEIDDIRPFNALGIPGWWAKGKLGSTGVGRSSVALYDVLTAAWRPIETVLKPRVGLSLIAQARRPA